jgi:apolipoprotein N-acyltransferase
MKKDEFNVLYKARQSVPVAMWKPWSKDNVKNNWFENPVFEISGKKATALICYEAYLTWPVLQSFLSGNPEIILFVSNHWWSKNTSLLSIQKTCVNAWASLFATQVVSAINF